MLAALPVVFSIVLLCSVGRMLQCMPAPAGVLIGAATTTLGHRMRMPVVHAYAVLLVLMGLALDVT